jgi:hypothetical protein
MLDLYEQFSFSPDYIKEVSNIQVFKLDKVGESSNSGIAVVSNTPSELLQLDLPRVSYVAKDETALITMLKPSVDFSRVNIEPIITPHLVLRRLDRSDIK